MNIAIIGGMGSGKTTILTELVTYHGYTRMSWADPVKDLARLAYGHIEKNEYYEIRLPNGTRNRRSGREILQRIGTDALRDQVDQDFWIRCGIRRMHEAEDNIRWVNDDTRFPNEVEALRSRGFRIVRLVVPAEERARRLGIRLEEVERLSGHPSEQLITSLSEDVTFYNHNAPPNEVARAILSDLTESAA